MIDTIWARHVGLAAIGFGLAAATVYYLMVTVTLYHLECISGTCVHWDTVHRKPQPFLKA